MSISRIKPEPSPGANAGWKEGWNINLCSAQRVLTRTFFPSTLSSGIARKPVASLAEDHGMMAAVSHQRPLKVGSSYGKAVL